MRLTRLMSSALNADTADIAVAHAGKPHRSESRCTSADSSRWPRA